MAESESSNSLLGLKTEGGHSPRARGKREGHTKHRQIAEDVELQLNEIVGMYPVFGGLANESALRSACTRVTFYRVPLSPYKVIQAGKLDNDRVPIVFVERSFVKIVMDESCL
jgi:hypothetical protein